MRLGMGMLLLTTTAITPTTRYYPYASHVYIYAYGHYGNND